MKTEDKTSMTYLINKLNDTNDLLIKELELRIEQQEDLIKELRDTIELLNKNKLK